HLSVAAVRLGPYRPVLGTDARFEGFRPLAEHGQRRAGANSKYRWQKDPRRSEWNARRNDRVAARSVNVPDAGRCRFRRPADMSVGQDPGIANESISVMYKPGPI